MKNFTKKLQVQFSKMAASGKLFRVDMTGQQVWDLYLASFEKDPVFRDPNATWYTCNNCNNFIRRYGNIVSISNDMKIETMFDVEAENEFVPVAKALSAAIKASTVTEVFFETFQELNSLPYEKCTKSSTSFQLGLAKNVKQYTKEEAEKFGVVNSREIYTFDHMHLFLSREFVDMTGSSVESIQGNYREAKNVFQRAMETISLDTLQLVRDLIVQGSLLDGQTHLHKIEKIIPLKKEYDKLDASSRNNWCWVNSYKLPFAKFRNELIGTLCSELSEGEDLNKAVQAWNKRVDPVNYMKTTAPITKKQIEDAKKFVEENGYVESFDRRFANIADIKASEILHVNSGKGDIKNGSIFDEVKTTATPSRHKRNEFDGVEEVSIEKFMKDILPGCSSVEVFLKNSHEGHMVSLTTSNVENSKPIFKWNNNYSWTFNGNLAGKSQIKEAVKSAGGKVDGVLRFSITWNEDGKDIVDMDAHATQPDRTEIYYGSYKGASNKTTMSGFIDVDMIRPSHLGVENIVWSNASKMKDGQYRFWIKNFCGGPNKGFKAEIEFNGETYTYEYNKPLAYKQDVGVAEVTLTKGEFEIKHLIPESAVSSKEIYGLETNQFHKVNLICLSPNHWGENNVGNKHYMFMLDGAKSPTSIRSFHNENLIPELAQHRKVLEVLGTTNMIEPTVLSDGKKKKKSAGKDVAEIDAPELSGLGFNATVKDEVLVRLTGNFKRMLKIKFN